MEILFKQSSLSRRLLLMGGAMFFIVFCSVSSITAQTFIPNIFKRKPPIALERDEPLSPANVANYRLIVEEYAKAACLPIVSPNGIGPTGPEVNRLRQTIALMESAQKQQAAALKVSLDEARKKSIELQAQIDQLNDKIKELTAPDGTESQIEDKKIQLGKLTNQSERVRSDLITLLNRRRTAAVQTRIDDLNDLSLHYGNLISVTQADIDRLNKHLDDRKNNRIDAQGKLDKANIRITEVKAQIAELEPLAVTTPASTPGSEGCNAAEATRLRNNLIFIAIAQSDMVFMNYRAKRRGWSDALELFLNFLEIGLSTSVSITNGLRAKSVLSDVTTLVQGTHSAFRKDLRLAENQVYFNMMETRRLAVFNEILKNMIRPDRDYSYAMALMDIVKYAKAGTLDDALGELQAMTGSRKQEEEAKVVDSKGALVGRVPTVTELSVTLSAHNTLNNIATLLVKPAEGATAPEIAAAAANRDAAFTKLTSIVNGILADAKIVEAIDKEPSLKDVFAALKAQLNEKDPDALLGNLYDFREQMSSIAGFKTTAGSIDTIISNKGK